MWGDEEEEQRDRDDYDREMESQFQEEEREREREQEERAQRREFAEQEYIALQRQIDDLTYRIEELKDRQYSLREDLY